MHARVSAKRGFNLSKTQGLGATEKTGSVALDCVGDRTYEWPMWRWLFFCNGLLGTELIFDLPHRIPYQAQAAHLNGVVIRPGQQCNGLRQSAPA